MFPIFTVAIGWFGRPRFQGSVFKFLITHKKIALGAAIAVGIFKVRKHLRYKRLR